MDLLNLSNVSIEVGQIECCSNSEGHVIMTVWSDDDFNSCKLRN